MTASSHPGWVRIPSTRAQMDALLDGYQISTLFRHITKAKQIPSPELLASIAIFQRQLQDDMDLMEDPRFAAMYQALVDDHTINEKLLIKALWRPVDLALSRLYPLYASEMSHLAGILGHNVPAKTIERLAHEGLISAPVLIGTSSLPRPVYFGRHLLEILYSQLFLDLKPSLTRAYLDILSGRLDNKVLLYLGGLPGVNPKMLQAVLESSQST